MQAESAMSVSDWTVNQVVEWVQALDLDVDVSELFLKHGMNGFALLRLSAAHLTEMGIRVGGKKKSRLLTEVYRLRIAEELRQVRSLQKDQPPTAIRSQ
ncbi:hypothetical protein CAOG_03537 [Capsaspora owczarzaki ATCC 30864]|uniref:SAM domain-containing protein n=1 Tax=Capsaspora owczarzaki (strain ATCC 30864) TaxID=595528 RepID=A0A0D2WPM1_CAPO3|nr:hypothetical protein CAOG_03537 [Capsaspora owczarzaki ATCC 30864]KJE92613.1 hypothetical protein CAOG_003537 [Capsaspora owczarzaki ATCC 30864]|eukprot:XP_004348442.1 hypothetical protein CAOG_03537 [Capsaspora owczarzaki ATCC 30864]